MKPIIFLITLLLVALALFFCLCFIFYIKKRNKKLKQLVKQSQDKLGVHKEEAISTIMNRVSAITNANSDLKQLNKRLEVIYNAFVAKMKIVNKWVYDFQIEVERVQIFAKKAREIYASVKAFYPIIQEMEQNFYLLSNQVTFQDETLFKKFTFYQTSLRSVLDVYVVFIFYDYMLAYFFGHFLSQ